MPLDLDFRADFPKGFKLKARKFAWWLDREHPLRQDYAMEIWHHIEGLCERIPTPPDTDYIYLTRVITRWQGGKRMRKATVEHALWDMAHEYFHLFEMDHDTDYTEDDADNFADEAMKDALAEGVI